MVFGLKIVGSAVSSVRRDGHGLSSLDQRGAEFNMLSGSPDPVRLRFTIGAYTPSTMPMTRFIEYMSHLAKLLGEPKHVHLVGVVEGTTTGVVEIDSGAYPAVSQRLDKSRQEAASQEMQQIHQEIDDLLRADRADGATLVDDEGQVLATFAGATTDERLYGPFTQPDSLDGQLIAVGGQNDPVPVRVQAPDTVYYCSATRALAKEMSTHLWGAPLRVWGTARWSRGHHEEWSMHHFRIERYEVLSDESLADLTGRLRAIDADWKNLENPFEVLADIRGSDD